MKNFVDADGREYTTGEIKRTCDFRISDLKRGESFTITVKRTI